MANEILALLSSQLLSFTKGINIAIVIDVFTPVEQRRTCKSLVNMINISVRISLRNGRYLWLKPLTNLILRDAQKLQSFS